MFFVFDFIVLNLLWNSGAIQDLETSEIILIYFGGGNLTRVNSGKARATIHFEIVVFPSVI
jgi:hypothetical protein